MRSFINRYTETIRNGGGGQAGSQFFPEAEEQGLENTEALVHPRCDPRLGEQSMKSEIIIEEVKE